MSQTVGYGVLAVPLTVAKATAPLGASLVRGATGSYAPVAVAVAVACALAPTGLAALPRPAVER